ncbi:hypothetical protein [Nostoc sp. CMAA1605]|nr:hypothetical protein [Nostoc sp. CMAA1605]
MDGWELGDWGLGTGDWGLGIGDKGDFTLMPYAPCPLPNSLCPIPNFR